MAQHTIEFCEREYNARAMITDHPQIFARWAQQAASTRRLRACLLDLPYGESAAEKLDLFPARIEGAPLLVFIHGGFWRSLDKSDFSWIAPPYVARGVSVALINYGLAPATPVEDIVRQTLHAIAWLYRNGVRYGFNPQRLFVSGHSAGGHLTAMTMAALWPQWNTALPTDLVKGGVAVSGLFDLEPLMHAPFINVDLKLDPARAARLSPVLLPAATRAPFITAVGALESSEFQRQTKLIGTHWANNLICDISVARANHLTVVDEMADPASPIFNAILEMMGQ